MSTWRMAVQGARFYWRTHLGVMFGTALAAMVLIGSLLVGDSVKATLKRQALLRVGQADAALVTGDRFFREQLADEIGGGAAPVLFLRGSIARADGAARINQAQVLGVDQRFGAFAPAANVQSFTGDDQALRLNARAAQQLGAKVGDTLIIRVEKPGAFSRDAPLSGSEDEVVAIRAEVAEIVSDEQFGRFSLAASQVPPFSAFLPLHFLQKRLEFEGKANLLLARGSAADLAKAVKSKWTLEDASLQLTQPPTGGIELRTSRVFLELQIAQAAPRGLDALTYLVNELRAGDKATPYSMVTAVDAPSSGFLPAELSHDEIVISQWLADDLGVGLNDRIALKYYVMGERRQLVETTREFEIIQILPMTEPQLNSSWMPDFPGLSDAENCRDWEPGFAIDNTKIRDVDEKYWDEYRGTPKAFVNIAVGQEMWGNRWGNLSAIRYSPPAAADAVAGDLRARLSPEQIGFAFVPLREQALAATNAPVDFGELFVGFSFFLIAAAAVLTGLLFVFTLEQRNAEAGTLLALGLTPRLVRRMLLAEGALLAVIGSLLGLAGAFFFTKLVLRGLATVWRGAVGAVDFTFAATPLSLIGGAVGSVVVALFAMWLASRRQLRQSARELLSGERALPLHDPPQLRLGIPAGVAIVSLLGAGVLALFSRESAAFFGAGALLLIGGISAGLVLLRRSAGGGGISSLQNLGVRNAARRRGRSLATVAVLASGVFMVVAVDSFRHRPLEENATKHPGTGGFSLIAEAALPIYEDLNSAAGREAYGLDENAMKEVRVVPMRVRDGDDASCLNLNRALQPRLLGVQPQDFAARGAFVRSEKSGPDWLQLNRAESDGAVPGLVDATTLKYALQMKIGDTIEYRDERGAPFLVRVIATVPGTILQGNVLIAERQFTAHFPALGGYRYFLIEAPVERQGSVASELARALQDRGFEVTPAARRLAEFQAVENTYLSIFQVLGFLGLLLGSAGLAIVVARNVLERRREFGLLEAVGFRPRQLRSMVMAEHRWLIVAALLIGTLSALLAVWPSLSDKAGGFPLREVGLLVLALAIGCIFWTWLATQLALRGSSVAALRAE